MSIKKIVFSFAVLALFLGLTVAPASAQTTDIAALMAEITRLSNLINSIQGGGGTGMPATTCSFTKDLTVDSTGADVTCLQNYLIASGHNIPAGATGYFGTQTKTAVTAWQAANGVSPTLGFFGPKSQLEYYALTAGSGSGSGSGSGPCTGGTFPSPVTGMCPGTSTLPAGCQPGDAFSRTVVGLSCTVSTQLPTGCQPGDAFSRTVVGLSCTAGAALPAGCQVGDLASRTTGLSCAGGTTVIPGGTEGSITTRLGTTPTPDTNIRRTTDVSVYGVEVEAVSSDMIVDRADLQFAVTTWDTTTSFGTGSVQNPGAFIKNIKAWDGSTQLGSWDVSASSFSKDSSDRYHIILSGLGSRVTKGMKKHITFSVSVNSIGTTDVPRRLAFQGYAGNTQNIRATDSVGLQSYADMSGTANTRTHDFKAAGNATLTVTTNSAATPKAGNTRINTTTGITKKIMQAFDAKAETGDAKMTKLYVGTNATSSTGVPSTYYLCDGSDTGCANPLYSVSAAATDNLEAAFTNMSILVPQDTTKTFLIAADFPTTVGGQQASSSIHTNAVQWEKPDGSTASSTPSSEIAGNDQYFAAAVPQWTMVSSSVDPLEILGTASPATTTATYHMVLKVTGSGGALTKPALSDFVIRFASSTATTYSAANATSTSQGDNVTGYLTDVTPTDATVGDGGSYTVTLTGILRNRAAYSTVNITGPYFMVITSAQAAVGGNTVAQTWNLDSFKTPSLNTPSGY